MDDHVISRAEGENEIFTFDVSDDAHQIGARMRFANYLPRNAGV